MVVEGVISFVCGICLALIPCTGYVIKGCGGREQGKLLALIML